VQSGAVKRIIESVKAIKKQNEPAALSEKRRYASELEIAAIYGVSVRTLRKWRLFGRGPVFYKLGRCVRYDVAEVDRYVRSTGSTPAEAR
jgi:hypothetical protein